MSEAFVNPILSCMNPNMSWPSIAGPGGLPNFMLGMFSCQMAGINYVLDFLPPSPDNLPSIPSIQIFADGFMGSINFPCDLPEIDLGGGVSIPAGSGGDSCGFDTSGAVKLIIMLIKLPFQIISAIIEEIINSLSVVIPSVALITDIFSQLAIDLGLSGQAISNLGGCVAIALNDLLTGSLV